MMHPACISIFLLYPFHAHYNNIPHPGGYLQMGIVRNVDGVADVALGQLLDGQCPGCLGRMAEGAGGDGTGTWRGMVVVTMASQEAGLLVFPLMTL